jgi:hypothetical protein
LVLNRSVQINIDYLIINKMVFEMPSDWKTNDVE